MGKAKIISIINYKGGVGKTVSAFNIAAGLNFLNQNSVLLIDLDPQGNATTGLGVDKKNMDSSIYDVIINEKSVV